MTNLLDLSTEIRLQIVGYVFDTEARDVFTTTSRAGTELQPPPMHWWRLCACANVIRPLHKTDLKVDPSCGCSDPPNDVHDNSQDNAPRMSLFSVSKQIHNEAKDAFQNSIIAFRHSADLGSMLLAELPGQAPRKDLTTLELTICPRSPETHIWNLALRQLYLPHGTMVAPHPHFLMLKAVRILVRGKVSPSRIIGRGSEGWDALLWIFAFRYLALEGVLYVEVDAIGYAEVSLVEEEGIANETIGPTPQILSGYERKVREFLLEEFEPGEQDDVELSWYSYSHKLGEFGMVEDLDD
ncbi:hypothetical protein P171DRAFT_428369 [Karstenula rhodostoma CBS 690.94]|uniref:F-box domain-containing protein n=1 Tax=Karstenula rhodostoma CBS 690.94 TaxID=1392251 RepID=A0A9P4UF89_9PLEO|nr:hypothetical protein P171DRAFT_428369 [Karstenula rhodostoma CBS 690.94]